MLVERTVPGGMLGLFYVCPESFEPSATLIAQELAFLADRFSVIDLTPQNIAQWRSKKQILLDLEPGFRAEGNLFLFKNRLAECDGWEHRRRFLYLANL